MRPPKKTTILLSGAPGTGKSTLQRRARDFFLPRLGETAAIGTDEVYEFVDPDFCRTGEEWARCARITRENCILLAQSLFRQGMAVVVIAGNALYAREDVFAYAGALRPVSAVFHVTLDARIQEVVRRVAARGDAAEHPPEWLASWREHIRAHLGPWTQVIDTTDQTPDETLTAIYDRVCRREGELTAADAQGGAGMDTAAAPGVQ